ncbi:MAG: hypothetical protein JRE19_17675 [Deltaproteobacteria bacterium]|nr:hypothetical protein [Deltaproteobacteria bacterium]
MVGPGKSRVLALLLLAFALTACGVDPLTADDDDEDLISFRVDLLNETAKPDFGARASVIFTVEYQGVRAPNSTLDSETITAQSQVVPPGPLPAGSNSQRLDVDRLLRVRPLVTFTATIPGTSQTTSQTCSWRADRGASDFDTRLVTFTGDKTEAQLNAGEIPTYRIFCFFW